jgi:hypothetical protein
VSDFDPPEEPDTPLPLPVQEKKMGYLLVAFLIGLLCVVPAYLVAYSRGYSKVQAEAVKTGHATYKVTDEFGHTKFEWLVVPGTSEKK